MGVREGEKERVAKGGRGRECGEGGLEREREWGGVREGERGKERE